MPKGARTTGHNGSYGEGIMPSGFHAFRRGCSRLGGLMIAALGISIVCRGMASLAFVSCLMASPITSSGPISHGQTGSRV